MVPAALRHAGPVEWKGNAVVGKIVRFDDATWALVNLLHRERRRSFQQLADEAFRDLLEKHGHPIKLKDQLRESVEEARPPERAARKRKP